MCVRETNIGRQVDRHAGRQRQTCRLSDRQTETDRQTDSYR